MKRLAMALPILVGACASWPSGSYVAVQDSDATVLAPAIADYLAGALPVGTAVAVAPAQAGNSIGPLLAANLDRDGIVQSPAGKRVQYVADQLDGGVLLRISIDGREGGGQFFCRTNGTIRPAGPMMVALP